MKKSRSTAAAAAAAMALIIGSVTFWLSASPAQAVAACLQNGDYALKSGYEVNTANNLASRGTYSTIDVPSGGVSCQHINSIYVGRGQGFAEFGWIRGYSNCPGYDTTKYTRPTLFRWFINTTGQRVGCRVFTSRQPAPGAHGFRISDTNGNYYWGPYIDGDEIEPNGTALDFNAGQSYLGMERGNANDPGTGDFDSLGIYSGGSSLTAWATHARNGANFGPGNYNIIAVNHARTVN